MPGPFIACTYEENQGYQGILLLLVCKKSCRIYFIWKFHFILQLYNQGMTSCKRWHPKNTEPGGGNMIHAFNVCHHCLDSPLKKNPPRSCLIRLHLTVDLNGHIITFLNVNQLTKCFKYLSQSVSTVVLLTELEHQSNEFQDAACVYIWYECWLKIVIVVDTNCRKLF